MGFFDSCKHFMVCSTVCLLRIFTVYSHVTFVLFILVYKTIIGIQPSIALVQIFVCMHLHSVLRLTISPQILPPFLPEETFRLTCCWTGWSLYSSVSSLKYVPQFTQQSWSCSYSDQSLEWAVISSLYTCISFPRKQKYGGSGKRKVLLLLMNPQLGTELWILHVFCDNESASSAFAAQLNRQTQMTCPLCCTKK